MLLFLTGAIVTTSRRGHPIIQIGPYRYNKHGQTRGPKVLWPCVKWTSRGCRASVTTIEGAIIATKNEHNHD